ncbi:hypothetical protein Taro_025387 [Colocasia esculenta]|uniref:Uncharacterized protein n=1 Tax=Colocasia esculenta TaxID=4460 RepID=A0A843V9A5_COLES|nr:hypothetical protein [Colocasia esculenta]
MWIKHKERLNHYHTHKDMKGVEVEEFRDVEIYPDEELFVVVIRKNFKLCLDRSLFICRQVHYSSVNTYTIHLSTATAF